MQSSYGGRPASYGAGISADGDGFIARLSADGATLLQGTYFGGADNDRISGVAVTTDGEIVVTGHTASSNFPVTSGAQLNLPGRRKR